MTEEDLKKIFFGEMPKTLFLIDSKLISEAFSRQELIFQEGKLPNVFDINYETLSKDIVQLLGDMPKVEGFSPEEIQRNTGILMRSFYFEFINSKKNDVVDKFSVSYFFRKVLENFLHVRNVELIDNQEWFINYLIQIENECITEVNKAFAIAEKQRENHQFRLSSLWPYSLDILILIGKELKEDAFVHSSTEFQNVFDENLDFKCNWKGKGSTLIYLLWLLLDKGTDKVSSDTFRIVTDKFLVNGKQITMKVAQSTRIKAQMDAQESELKGDYAKIYGIYKSVTFQ